MTLRALAVVALLSACLSCQCGTGSSDPCASTLCGNGLTCEPKTGRCVSGTSDGGTGGGTATGGGTGGGTVTGGGEGGGQATCSPACTSGAPICDNGTCKTCTATSGCSGAAPACLTTAAAGLGACVQCLTNNDCPVLGTTCDTFSYACVTATTGGGAGGGSGGGTVTGGGAGGGSMGPPIFDDAGVTAHCANFSGPPGQSCTNSENCAHGYECISNTCQLRGHSGPVQVTLRWGTETDLDLYLVEPLLDGGTCEIYYSQPGPTPCSDPLHIGLCKPDGGFVSPILGGSTCGSKGWLDLDANRGCDMSGLTNSPVENIIYSPGVPVTSGTYTVRANNWSACSISPPIPWEVEVRANGQTRYYCGQFQGSGNGGAAGAGDVVTTFTLP